MPVPLLDLQAQYAPIRDEINAAIQRVLDSGVFILGPEVASLESEIAAYSGCQFGIGVTSGTDALLVALMACDIKPGDEIITTPFSFFATAGSIARLQAKPVFVDIEPDGFNLDPHKIESAITPRTKAIMPVHLYGQMAEMNPIMEVATKHNLFVIEDAAQSIGAEYQGRRAGSIGHFGCFSFYPSKNLGCPGDGGMITTNDPALAARVKALRNHGSTTKYYHTEVGGNFRLDALQAAILRVKLQYLDDWTAARQRNAGIYHRECRANGQFATSAIHNSENNQSDQPSVNSITLPVELPHRRHVYNQFVIRTKRRDALLDNLKSQQIGCEIYYPLPLHLQECFAGLGYQIGDFPVAEAAAQEVLAIPIYPELTEAQMQQVVEILKTTNE
jgi:dTDP-4-amino-4,6-dideoxygalactose transaminase